MVGQTAAYIRVSSLDQNTVRQEEAIGAADRTFLDRASGKSRTERPALQEMLQWAREGDRIKIASMDRLARSVIDLHQIVDEITSKGAKVEFLKEALVFGPGPQDATARLLMAVMGAVAEFERAIIHERQAEGIAAAKARGAYRGRKPRLTTEQIQMAREQIAEGKPKAAVARDLGCARQTLYTALATSE